MKFQIEVTSKEHQATNWILAGIKRNLSGENNEAVQKACEDTAKELKFSIKFEDEIYKFGDLQ